MKSHWFVGLLYAIGACFVWGLIFVIPQYLKDYSAIEVVLGRYFSYGALSLLLFFRTGFSQLRRCTLKEWVTALIFALFSNLIYYIGFSHCSPFCFANSCCFNCRTCTDCDRILWQLAGARNCIS